MTNATHLCPRCAVPCGSRCDCGEIAVPRQPMPEQEPEPLDLSVGIEFGIFGPGDTGRTPPGACEAQSSLI